ncbi:MAG: hypothetical protein QF530_01180 [SAR202 cluster bacterium]|nr:hypothetical protein [SAR202 cluster bacterium]
MTLKVVFLEESLAVRVICSTKKPFVPILAWIAGISVTLGITNQAR